jgi:Ca2+-binding RTX toxin-like protein
MPIAISSQDIQTLITKVQNGDITAGYRSLSALGFHYVDWAFGVAKENTIAGVSAVNFLEGTASAGVGDLPGQTISQESMQSIKKGMALAYLEVLSHQAETHGGIASQDIDVPDVWAIHKTVFERNGLSIENWTLDAPFKVIERVYGPEVLEATWSLLRDTSGTYADAIVGNTIILATMRVASKESGDPEIRAWADTWIQHVPVVSYLYNEMSWGNALLAYIEYATLWVPPALNIKDILTDLGGGILDLIISPAYGDAPLSENQILIGSKGIDSINGTEKAELLYGGVGNDTLIGNGGNDFLQGGQGSDTYIYTTGDGFDARLCKNASPCAGNPVK